MTDGPLGEVNRAIVFLREVDSDQIDSLIEAVSALDPTSSQSEYVSAIVGATGLQEVDVRVFISALLSFLSFAYQASTHPSDRAKRFLQSTSIDYQDEAMLLSRISRLLSIPSLCVRAKADHLHRAHSTELLSSMIITDQRPVFGEYNGEPTSLSSMDIQGFFIYENLNLTYIQEGRELRTLSLACDYEDLDALRVQIERALLKHKKMEATLRKDDHPIWFPSVQDTEEQHV